MNKLVLIPAIELAAEDAELRKKREEVKKKIMNNEPLRIGSTYIASWLMIMTNTKHYFR